MLGSGKANGKKDAGMKAAEMALANKKMMKGFLEKKKIFDGKMWGLRYTPEKNKEPAQGVLKSLSEKLKKSIISEPFPISLLIL